MKRIYQIISLFILLAAVNVIHAQQLTGIVYERYEDREYPLPGVNVYWSGTQIGTVTDVNGRYTIEYPEDFHWIVFSFVGYANDTIHTPHHGNVMDHVMTSPTIELNEVEVVARAKSSYVSRLSTINATHIGDGELRRAACCNLAESFETNASVDVSYSDAVTGAKQIELLGLSGVYSQMMAENMPNLRGLASSFGLTYVPGTWMQAIQVSKGASSVVNGYESITGQINIDYKKPEESEKLFLNLFQSSMGRTEVNMNAKALINKDLQAMVLGHFSNNGQKHDENKDGFLDDPLYRQYNFFGRLNFNNGTFEGMFGIKGMKEDRQTGQKQFDPKKRFEEGFYGVEINTERAETFLKTGYIFDRENTSLGIQQQFIYHDLQSYYGLTDYNAKQYSYYLNALFNSYIVNERHVYTAGFSYSYDEYNESLNDSTFNRFERVPGVFAEYTYKNDENLSVIAGMRVDHHSTHGWFATPRLHARYRFNETFILRGSIGKGYRSPNVLAENSTMLASSRAIVFQFNGEAKMEEALNYGLNLTKTFDVNRRELTINLDFYRTDFQNQIVIDRDTDVHKILIYNLNGKSYSNSAQIEVNYEVLKGLDVTAAFRYNDVKMTINDALMEKPLVNKYKGLVTLSYLTPKYDWQFDFTTQFNGTSRIPSTATNPEAYRRSDKSPEYIVMNAQVSKKLGKFDVYVGGENLTGYTQKNPIIASDDPFGDYFDSSLVWGPLSGVKFYAGLRFTIE
ncbi:MAG: TonB-dependent receptor [Lentimicrobiaceae bacterium]|jgi:outer membrane receptor for ferrienterochelin and colicin|nr:TonB-dependent receptor [Lentimicrobiaceae bacterium]